MKILKYKIKDKINHYKYKVVNSLIVAVFSFILAVLVPMMSIENTTNYQLRRNPTECKVIDKGVRLVSINFRYRKEYYLVLNVVSINKQIKVMVPKSIYKSVNENETAMIDLTKEEIGLWTDILEFNTRETRIDSIAIVTMVLFIIYLIIFRTRIKTRKRRYEER